MSRPTGSQRQTRLGLARIAMAEIFDAKGEFYTGCATVVLRVFLMGQLWTALTVNSGDQAAEYIRAVVVLNIIVTSVQSPWEFTSLPARVRSGNIVSDLLVPVSLTTRNLSLQTGSCVAQLPRAACGAVAAVLLGYVPSTAGEPGRIVTGALLLVCGTVIALLVQFIIGLTSFWIVDVAPVKMAYRALGSILTGAVVPLSLFPPGLREVVSYSPFGLQSNAAAETLFGSPTVSGIIVLLGAQLFWIVLLLATVMVLERRGMQQLVLFGG